MNEHNPTNAPRRRMKPNSAMPEPSAERSMSMSDIRRVKKQKMARMYCPSVILVLELLLFGIEDFCIVFPINV